MNEIAVRAALCGSFWRRWYALPLKGGRFVCARLARLGRALRHHPRISAASFFLLLATLAVAVPYGWAWFHWQKAQSCLARARPQEALRHLEACRKVWPNRPTIPLLSARAARQAGLVAEAERHLADARQLQPDGSPELLLENALHRAALGDLEGSIESFLRKRMGGSGEEGRLVAEALAEGYIRNYRGAEALAILDEWQKTQPDDLRAWDLRGQLWRQAEATSKATACYRRLLELDPERDEARRWLALGLLEGGEAAESLPHWEQLHGRHPDDADIVVHLARCRHQLGEDESARALLESVLSTHPDRVLALHTLGEILLQQRQLKEAEACLRRALELAPHDYPINGLLAHLLQQQGRLSEAEVYRKQSRHLEACWKQFRETARKMSEQPHNPALLCQLGAALLDLGYDDLSLRWFLYAVHLDPRCRCGHELLAQWYEKHRDGNRAAQHRRLARAIPARPSESP